MADGHHFKYDKNRHISAMIDDRRSLLKYADFYVWLELVQ